MSGFTAQQAREIVASDSHSTRGYVIDQVRKAAKNGQTNVSIPELNLNVTDETYFKNVGFKIINNNISWKEDV